MDEKKILLEIQKILKPEIIDLNSKIKELKKLYKDELKGFKYVDDPNIFLQIKNKYIRYIGFNNKINYGGFFLKAVYKGNTVYIYLINKDKKVWYIDFNRNYVFINDIINENVKMRKAFELYLLENENK